MLVGVDVDAVEDVVQEVVMVAMHLLTFQLHQLKILGNSLLWVSSENFSTVLTFLCTLSQFWFSALKQEKELW